MKKRWAALFAAAVGCVLLAPAAFAEGEAVTIDEAHFPDEAFRTYVSTNFDTDADGVLSEAECNAVTVIRNSILSGDTPFLTLEGIEYFPKLTTLQCDSNPIGKLDVSRNPALTELHCANCELTELDLTHNPNLWLLDCSSNALGSLDVSKNPKLYSLRCGSCKLTELDVSSNTYLSSLDCDANLLTTLDVSKNKNLTSLVCRRCFLTELDISANTLLTSLYCDSNNLSTLDVSSNTELSLLWLAGNHLAKLELYDRALSGSFDGAGDSLYAADPLQNISCPFEAHAGTSTIDMRTLVGEDFDRVSIAEPADAIYENGIVTLPGNNVENFVYIYDVKGTYQNNSYSEAKTAILRVRVSNSNYTTDAGEDQSQLQLQISSEVTPSESLAAAGYDTPEKIQDALIQAMVTDTGYTNENTQTLEVTLMVSTDGGATWTAATSEDFPAGGLDVTLAYPEGTTAAEYDFIVTHMCSDGSIETLLPAKESNGLKVHVNSLSPFGIAWKAVEPSAEPAPAESTAEQAPQQDEHPEIAAAIADGSWGKPESTAPTPAPTAQPAAAQTSARVPQTGDSFPILPLAGLMAASMAAVFVLAAHKKRSK